MINADEKKRMRNIAKRWAERYSKDVSIEEYIKECFETLTGSLYGWNEEGADYICKQIIKELEG